MTESLCELCTAKEDYCTSEHQATAHMQSNHGIVTAQPKHQPNSTSTQVGSTGGKSQNPFWEASVSVRYFLPDSVWSVKPDHPHFCMLFHCKATILKRCENVAKIFS